MNAFVRNHSPLFRVIVYLSLITFTVACTSMHVIPITELENLPNQLVVGDKVEVTGRNGEIVEFRVEKITESGISGQDHAIAYDEMQQLRVARSNGSTGDNKFLWITLGITLVILALGDGPQEIQGY